MPSYSASSARRHFSDLLDAAAAGEPVLVERRGQLFRLELVPPASEPARAGPLFVAEPSLLSGDWSFDADGTFRPGPG